MNKSHNILFSIPTTEYIKAVIEKHYPIKLINVMHYRKDTYFLDAEQGKYVLKYYSPIKLNDPAYGAAFDPMQSAEIMGYLAENGFPVPEIIRTVENALHFSLSMPEGDGLGILFTFIDGKIISYKDDFEKLAINTAKLHKLMGSYQGPLHPLSKPFYFGRMVNLLDAFYPGNKEAEEIKNCGDIIWREIEKLPEGFCHGDYDDHNMINKSGKIYVYDFDVAAYAYPMFDIALICSKMHFWKFKKPDADKTEEDIHRFADIYTKIYPLSGQEIEKAMYFIGLRQFEVRANVAYNIMLREGSYFLNEGYLKTMHKWLMNLMAYIKL